MKTAYCLVDTNPLTKSQVISKQIAHNELVGTQDSEVLGELVKQMQDVDDLIASGLPDKYLDSVNGEQVVMDLPQLDFQWRMISLTFLPKQKTDLETLVKLIDNKTEFVGVADRSQFDQFCKVMNKFGKAKNIRSISTTISVLVDIALKEIKKWQDQQNTTQSTT